jgi:DUF4097 and DUF4098 domain-containing protein YvlB
MTALVGASTAAAVADTQTRSVRLPLERSLTVDIRIGDVRVEGERRDDAEITIERRAPTPAGLSRILVDIREEEGEVLVRGVQADGGTDPALRTDVTLRVPRAARIRSVRIVEGRLSVARLAGSITADVRRGPIAAEDVQGVVRFETGIGDVTVDGARLTAGGLLRLRAFNGDIRLRLAERPADARILALALNGTIRSTIPLRMKDSWGPRWGEATLGKGEPVISLDVVTGRIEISGPR